jgi:hypothetical protein
VINTTEAWKESQSMEAMRASVNDTMVPGITVDYSITVGEEDTYYFFLRILHHLVDELPDPYRTKACTLDAMRTHEGEWVGLPDLGYRTPQEYRLYPQSNLMADVVAEGQRISNYIRSRRENGVQTVE